MRKKKLRPMQYESLVLLFETIEKIDKITRLKKRSSKTWSKFAGCTYKLNMLIRKYSGYYAGNLRDEIDYRKLKSKGKNIMSKKKFLIKRMEENAAKLKNNGY